MALRQPFRATTAGQILFEVDFATASSRGRSGQGAVVLATVELLLSRAVYFLLPAILIQAARGDRAAVDSQSFHGVPV